MLQKNNMKGAHDLLKRAEQVSEKSDLDRAITWNNLACYYRRMGKLRTAVTFLERALAIEEHIRNEDAAQTLLNLCATLSQLQRHADALYHAQSALIRIYEILSPLMLSGKLSTNGHGDEKHEQVTVLCIAYHNLAVEHEYLKNFEAAICAYAEGARWAAGFLGPGHQLIDILRKSLDAVKAKLPPNSGALKRADELAQGFPGLPLRSSAPDAGGSAASGSPIGSPGGSKHLENLMTTPRDSDDGYVDSPHRYDAKSPGGDQYSTDELGDESASYHNSR
jgi:tetratricopeptide (TPR) repeat protein